jgi:hypothetical protein
VIHSMRGWGRGPEPHVRDVVSSRMSGAVQQMLPGTCSSVTEPHWTPTVEWSQNSKAREGQPSAGSNPAATASRTRQNAGPAATWAPAFLAVVSNVVSIGPD